MGQTVGTHASNDYEKDQHRYDVRIKRAKLEMDKLELQQKKLELKQKNCYNSKRQAEIAAYEECLAGSERHVNDRETRHGIAQADIRAKQNDVATAVSRVNGKLDLNHMQLRRQRSDVTIYGADSPSAAPNSRGSLRNSY